jgi:hypothetical protein
MNGKANGWTGLLVNLLGVIVIVVSATLWLSRELHRIDTRLVAMEILVQDRWTRTDMQLWTQELVIMNEAGVLLVPRVHESRAYKPDLRGKDDG